MALSSGRWSAGALLLVVVFTLVPLPAQASSAEPARVTHAWWSLSSLGIAFDDLVQDILESLFPPSDQGVGGSFGQTSDQETETGPPVPPRPTDLGTSIDPNGCSATSEGCS